MKNSIGTSVILTLSGESHGEMICATLDGIPAGLEIDRNFIAEQLSKRRPGAETDTARIESDDFRIVSGVFNERSCGTPITILIPNTNIRSEDYPSERLARPSHADFVAHERYAGFEDYRGGGHFSGRITAGIVAAGVIVLKALNTNGVHIGTHILECAGVRDRAFYDCRADIELLDGRNFPVLSDVDARMKERILSAREEGDSVGGIIQTAITGLEAGLGEPWFDSLEGTIANAVFSIGGVKGVEFGLGFGFAKGRGSELNDQYEVIDGKVLTKTNNNGGINGGLSNGMPVVFNAAVKPTPSIYKEQLSVNLDTIEPASLRIKGRHDPAIIRRICPVVTALTAIVIADQLSLRYGTDYLRDGKR